MPWHSLIDFDDTTHSRHALLLFCFHSCIFFRHLTSFFFARRERAKSTSGAKDDVVGCWLESDLNQVVTEFFRHGSRLFRNDWVLVNTHDVSLCRLDSVHSAGPLLGTYHFVVGGEVHVFCAGDGHTTHGQLFSIVVLRYQSPQLIWSDREVVGWSPNISVVSTDDRVRHHSGVQQLIVDVTLPAHGCCAGRERRVQI